jgi:2-hydroxychromene-2-carboxylate isomerase
MPQQVDFFFDFASPYTDLAQTQLPALDADGGNAPSPGSVLGG